MDLSSINPALLVFALMVASTPLLLAAIGELVVEKAGVLNLGVEGMMITGAICGFIVAVETGSPYVGYLGAALGGAALSLVFALLTYLVYSNLISVAQAQVSQGKLSFALGATVVHAVMLVVVVLLFAYRSRIPRR